MYRGWKQPAIRCSCSCQTAKVVSDGPMGRVLLQAAKDGLTTIVDLCLKEGTRASVTDECKRTPLIIATINGHEDVVDLLLKQPDAWRWSTYRDASKLCAYEYAVRMKNPILIKKLLPEFESCSWTK